MEICAENDLKTQVLTKGSHALVSADFDLMKEAGTELGVTLCFSKTTENAPRMGTARHPVEGTHCNIRRSSQQRDLHLGKSGTGDRASRGAGSY